MSNPPSRRPPSGRRSARRSLVELTAAASRAAGQGLPVAPSASTSMAVDRMPPRVHAAQPSGEASNGGHDTKPEDAIPVGTGAAVQYRAESLELMQENVDAALDYARELMWARTLAECVELSSGFARRQCEFALRHAGALKALMRAAAQSDPS